MSIKFHITIAYLQNDTKGFIITTTAWFTHTGSIYIKRTYQIWNMSVNSPKTKATCHDAKLPDCIGKVSKLLSHRWTGRLRVWRSARGEKPSKSNRQTWHVVGKAVNPHVPAIHCLSILLGAASASAFQGNAFRSDSSSSHSSDMACKVQKKVTSDANYMVATAQKASSKVFCSKS